MHKSMTRKIAALMIGMTLSSAGMAFADTETHFVEPVLISAPVTAVNTAVEIMDGAVSNNYFNGKVIYNEAAVSESLPVVQFNGVKMIPLSESLTAMGFTVDWNKETQRIDISKGAIYTSVTIGENAYFRNRMAPVRLSSAPIDFGGHVYVPAEFLVEILGIGVMVEEGNLTLTDYEAATHEGYVSDIAYDETGMMTITLRDELDSDNQPIKLIVRTSKAYTFINTEVEIGAYIHVASPQFMTMIYPPQTSGYIVYSVN